MNEQQVLEAIKQTIINGNQAEAIQILKDYKAG
jgi:hypothetical protein